MELSSNIHTYNNMRRRCTAPVPTQCRYAHAPRRAEFCSVGFPEANFLFALEFASSSPSSTSWFRPLGRPPPRTAPPPSRPAIHPCVRPFVLRQWGGSFSRPRHSLSRTVLHHAKERRRNKRHLSCSLKKAAARISSRITSCLMRASATEPACFCSVGLNTAAVSGGP